MKKSASSLKKAKASSSPRKEESLVYLDKDNPVHDAALRSRAEEKFAVLPKRKTVTSIDAKKLVHELQVHQIELEMQNDELQQSLAKVEEMRSRYADLYDFSPAGHVTLDDKGNILEANLTIALLTGYDKEYLLHKPFSSIVFPDAKESFAAYFRRCILATSRTMVETVIVRKDNSLFHAQVEAMGFKSSATSFRQFLLAIFNISERKKAEAQRVTDAEDLASSRVDLVRFNRAAVDRELRMIELKKEVNELCRKHGEPQRYDMGFLGEP